VAGAVVVTFMGEPVPIGLSNAVAGRGKLEIGTESRRATDGAARSSPRSRLDPRACCLAARSGWA
jgi:hypothetical protein